MKRKMGSKIKKINVAINVRVPNILQEKIYTSLIVDLHSWKTKKERIAKLQTNSKLISEILITLNLCHFVFLLEKEYFLHTNLIEIIVHNFIKKIRKKKYIITEP